MPPASASTPTPSSRKRRPSCRTNLSMFPPHPGRTHAVQHGTCLTPAPRKQRPGARPRPPCTCRGNWCGRKRSACSRSPVRGARRRGRQDHARRRRRLAPTVAHPFAVDVREARVRGTRVRWRAAGAGPPLVLVHGLSGSSRWWDPVLPGLAERYECHVLDVPRFGASFRPDEAAEWVAAWADAAALDGIRLVGHSLGGAAAARLAALRPELVEALVLVSA